MHFFHQVMRACCLVVLVVGIGAETQAAPFTVSSTADDGSTNTLRWAINQSNSSTPGPNNIEFSGAMTITLTSDMVPITTPVKINTKNPVNVVIDGSASNYTPLTVLANGTQINQIAVIRGTLGMEILAFNCLVQSCRVGTNWNDTTGLGNTIGIDITNSGNTVTACVISGNGTGIRCGGHLNHFNSNLIGTNFARTALIPNTITGIDIQSTGYANLIDGSNIICGNGSSSGASSQAGVFIENYAVGNTVAGNYIGTNVSWASLGNYHYGLRIEGDHNFIGLPVAGGANYIGFNPEGIAMTANTGHHNIMVNNYVGTNPANALLGGSLYGIRLGGQNNLVGGLRGSGLLNRNIVANMANFGIYLQNDNNTVCGNYVGCNPTYSGTTPNANYAGIYVQGSHNLIGGSNPGGTNFYGNVISGNSGASGFNCGILCQNGQGNVIVGNYIGLSDSGTTPLPNDTGISDDTFGNIIGGTTPGERNVISGNVTGLQTSAISSIIQGNYFGTDASGLSLVKNTSTAIILDGSLGCLIGGTSPSQGNVICGGSGATPVYIKTSSAGNTLVGNYIGAFANLLVPSESVAMNVQVDSGAHDNSIGLKATHTGNLIAGGGQGVYLSGAATKNNGLYGNTICGFSTAGITLDTSANLSKAAPVVTSASTLAVSGTTSHTGDCIEVFLASRGNGVAGGSLKYLGSVVTSGTGWTVNVSGQGLVQGQYVCALASDSANNTSPFSNNFMLPLPTATPTSTMTPTVTATPTVTFGPTSTATPTPLSASPTFTATQTPLPIAWGGKAVLAFPNPARDTIKFAINLSQASAVKIEIYNVNADRVQVLTGNLTPEANILVSDCRALGAGIYLARVFVDGAEVVKLKVAVLK